MYYINHLAIINDGDIGVSLLADDCMLDNFGITNYSDPIESNEIFRRAYYTAEEMYEQALNVLTRNKFGPEYGCADAWIPCVWCEEHAELYEDDPNSCPFCRGYEEIENPYYEGEDLTSRREAYEQYEHIVPFDYRVICEECEGFEVHLDRDLLARVYGHDGDLSWQAAARRIGEAVVKDIHNHMSGNVWAFDYNIVLWDPDKNEVVEVVEEVDSCGGYAADNADEVVDRLADCELPEDPRGKEDWLITADHYGVCQADCMQEPRV